MPLKRQYHNNPLSKDLRRLRIRFYMYALFPNSKSVPGHTCYQIFIDGEGFFWIMPLFIKDEVGMELRAFEKQLVIPNELHFDRAADHIGPHSNFQCAIREFRI